MVSAPCRYLSNTISSIANGVEQLINFFIGPDYSLGYVSPTKITFGSKITRFRGQSLILSQQLPEIAMPTLLVWGDRDKVVPVKQAYRASKLIPDCKVKVFKGSGHSAHRDNLGEFCKLLKGFLG